MTPTDRNRYGIEELDGATDLAARCQTHCTPEAHALIAFTLSRLRSSQDACPSHAQINFQVQAFRSMLSSIAFADLMGMALPAARPTTMALARTLCESDLPIDSGGALQFLVRANSLQGQMMEIQRAEAFKTDHPATPHMQITAPDGW